MIEPTDAARPERVEETTWTNQANFESDVHGQTHTGSGDLNVYYTVQDSVHQQAQRPRLTPSEDLRWLRFRFVEPPGLGRARARLTKTGTVLLTGPAGSGRLTAAKMLADESGSENAPFSPLDDEGRDLEQRLSNVQVSADHRFVLDLSDSSEGVFKARMRELPTFRAELSRQRGYLAVVVPDELTHHLDPELKQFTERIERPSAELVLRSHLRAFDLTPTADQLADEKVTACLRQPMTEIARFAERVDEARDQLPDMELPVWLHEAAVAPEHRRKEVADLLVHHTTGRARAVLMASAMCRGASSDAVFFASDRLVAIQELGRNEPPRLVQDGFRTQLKNLQVDVSPQDSIEFSKLSYDEAILEHFWDNYPDLRESFRRWIEEVIGLRQLTGSDRMRIVDRFARQAFRTDAPAQVGLLAEKWIAPYGTESSRLRDFGVRALLLGLTDPRHGSHFRRMVYGWSCEDRLPERVGQILVRATVEAIAPKYPAQAVVRLHHRARREPGDLARRSLLDLVDGDPACYRLLLQRVTEELASQERWRADFLLFVEMADPHLLTDTSRRSQPLATDQQVRNQLLICWRALMSARGDLVDQRLYQWLGVAAQIPHPDLLLGLLVEAASPSVDLLGALYAAGEDWGRTAEGHPEVAIRLSQLIDLAQGLQNQDYMYPRPEEFVR